MKPTLLTVLLTGLCGAPAAALAQMEELEPVELAPRPAAATPAADAAPVMILEDFDTDERNAVLSAARTRTTIQRAPGIITVITADEIARRGHRTVNDVLRTVPGFEGGRFDSNGWFDESTSRGQPRTLLILINGVNVTSPLRNAFTLDRRIPVQAIKRIEVTSGPGGVLWGSNALLGVINIILKDANDLDGVLVSAGGGHGPGAQAAGQAHAAYGGQFFDRALDVFVSADVYTDRGAELRADTRKVLGVLPSPELDGTTLYDNNTAALTDFNSRDWWVSSTGQITAWQVLTLDWLVELERDHRQIATGGAVLSGTRPTDAGPVSAQEETRSQDAFQMASLTWRDRLGDGFGLAVKGYGVHFSENNDPFWAFPPQALPGTNALADGVALALEVGNQWRYGLNVDADVAIGRDHHLVFGAEVFQDRVSDAVRRDTLRGPARLPGLAQPGADDPQVAGGIFGPNRCPPAGAHGVQVGDATPIGVFDDACGFEETLIFDSARTIGALYISDEWSLSPKVVLQPGFRLQVSDSFDPVPLLGAALVWNLFDKTYLKLNYAEGFRPPELQSVGINPNGISSVSFQSDPNLDVERSRAAEAELNAVLLEGRGPFKRIYLRADYAYTVINDLVRNVGGRFANSGDRGIHSVEFLVRSELRGDHELWLGGHHVRAEDSVFGPVRNFPNWVFMGGARTLLLGGHLELSALATFVGAQEDLNRANDVGATLGGFARSDASDIEVDRIDAYVLLRAGVRVLGLWGDRLVLSGFVYNAADTRRADPDFFFDDRVQSRPQPREGLSVLGRAEVRF